MALTRVPSAVNQSKRIHMAVYGCCDIVSRLLRYQGKFENELLFTLQTHMRNETVLIDIGGNIGWWPFNFAATHEVHTFEPFVRNLALQNVTKCLNPELSRRIHTYPYGLYYEKATCELWQAPSINTGDTTSACGTERTLPIQRQLLLSKFGRQRGGGKLLGMAEMRVLDDTIPTDLFFRDKVVKIDVEGLELEALRGAMRLLSTGSPPRAILVEVRSYVTDKARATALLDFMWRFGYAPLENGHRRAIPSCRNFLVAHDVVFAHGRRGVLTAERGQGPRRRVWPCPWEIVENRSKIR